VPAATLSIPPNAEHVRTARLVAVAAARRAGLAEDVIDDVRLAVGEVVAQAVLRHAAWGIDRDVDLVIRDDGHAFSVEVSGEPRSPEGPSDADGDADDGVALALVHALVPEVVDTPGTVTLSWPLVTVPT
jgi:anti-sigma regulatory factor (Ser/Thr protein kinase)